VNSSILSTSLSLKGSENGLAHLCLSETLSDARDRYAGLRDRGHAHDRRYTSGDVINGHHPEGLLPVLILVAFAMLVQRALDYLRLLLNNTFEQKVIFDLRRDLYSHI
jgi:hypothetical protein